MLHLAASGCIDVDMGFDYGGALGLAWLSSSVCEWGCSWHRCRTLCGASGFERFGEVALGRVLSVRWVSVHTLSEFAVS